MHNQWNRLATPQLIAAVAKALGLPQQAAALQGRASGSRMPYDGTASTLAYSTGQPPGVTAASGAPESW